MKAVFLIACLAVAGCSQIDRALDVSNIRAYQQEDGNNCGKFHDERGRGWVPADSACGPNLSQISHIVLRDGRRCDYVYDAPGSTRLKGLWCDPERE